MEAEVLPRGRGHCEGVCGNIPNNEKRKRTFGNWKNGIWLSGQISSRHFTLVPARFPPASSGFFVFINAGQSFIIVSILFSAFGI